MKAEYLFSIVNSIALLGWILLAAAPGWIWTRRIVWTAIPLLLSAAYLMLVVLFFGQAEGGFGSLEAVMRLFTNKNVALAGWIHYLAFDLLVGSWEVKDALEKNISHWLVVPCLLLTFLLGPIGFLAYNGVRFFAAKGEKK